MRCVAAWVCRVLAIITASYFIVVLVRAYHADPTDFLEVFPFGLAEIGFVAFGAFGAFDLLGRLISWTKPGGPMPRLRDHAK
jgi:hypothetical protein